MSAGINIWISENDKFMIMLFIALSIIDLFPYIFSRIHYWLKSVLVSYLNVSTVTIQISSYFQNYLIPKS